MHWQVILLIVIILVSVGLSKLPFLDFWRTGGEVNMTTVATSTQTISAPSEERKTPVRNWEVPDPVTNARAIIVQSLDDNFPFFRYNSDAAWPMASLTKLMTAVIIMERGGLNQKTTVSGSAVKTEGTAGDLRAEEMYTIEDLLKIMLMSSSNDAAVAIEEHIGKDVLLDSVNKKEKEIGMTETVINDASGLDDTNTTTARDMLMLLKYILAKDPDILRWTRLTSLLVQPVNSERSHAVPNIDFLATRPDFLGGKTGTSPLARENLTAILSFRNRRIAVIILGSKDRVKETNDLLEWIEKAYTFGP